MVKTTPFHEHKRRDVIPIAMHWDRTSGWDYGRILNQTQTKFSSSNTHQYTCTSCSSSAHTTPLLDTFHEYQRRAGITIVVSLDSATGWAYDLILKSTRISGTWMRTHVLLFVQRRSTNANAEMPFQLQYIETEHQGIRLRPYSESNTNNIFKLKQIYTDTNLHTVCPGPKRCRFLHSGNASDCSVFGRRISGREIVDHEVML